MEECYFSNVAGWNLKLHYNNTPPWAIFHVFKIVQMLPNRAKSRIKIITRKNY